MCLFQKTPLNVEIEIEHYLRWNVDVYAQWLLKVSISAYLAGLKEIPQPINKKDLKDFMRGYMQSLLKLEYNKEGLTYKEAGVIDGRINQLNRMKELEPHSSFLSKLEAIVKGMEEIDSKRRNEIVDQ
jgi:hypothetical protein